MSTTSVNRRVSASSREPASAKMDYPAVRQYVETKLPTGLLSEWKEFIIQDERSKKMWSQEQPAGFVRKMITLSIYKDLSGLGY
jgi:hypothetical protein